jgi:hypothetical protein
LALSVPDQANAIIIKSNEDYARAGQLLITIKGIRKKIEDTFKPIKQKMDAAKKEVLDQEKAADAPLAKAEGIIKPRIAAWNAEQERIRKEEEDRLREIARKEEEERQLQEAILAEQSGNKAEAQAIIEAPVYIPPVVVPKTVQKLVGVSFTKQWKFRIVDESKIPRDFLKVDEVKIGGYVRSMKNAGNIPGVEIYSEDSVSGRAA